MNVNEAKSIAEKLEADWTFNKGDEFHLSELKEQLKTRPSKEARLSQHKFEANVEFKKLKRRFDLWLSNNQFKSRSTEVNKIDHAKEKGMLKEYMSYRKQIEEQEEITKFLKDLHAAIVNLQGDLQSTRVILQGSATGIGYTDSNSEIKLGDTND